MRLTADKPGSISFHASLNRPADATTEAAPGKLIMTGQALPKRAPGEHDTGVRFRAEMKAALSGGHMESAGGHMESAGGHMESAGGHMENAGGHMENAGGRLDVTAADSVTLTIVAATDYREKDLAAACTRDLASSARPMRSSAQEHIADHQHFFRRVHLEVHAAEEVLVVGDVLLAQDFIGTGRRPEIARTGRGKVLLAIVGGGHDRESHAVGRGHVETAAGVFHVAAGVFHVAAGAFHVAAGAFHVAAGAFHVAAGAFHVAAGKSRFHLGPEPDSGVVLARGPLRQRLAGHDQLARRRFGGGVGGPVQRGVERYAARLIGSQAHHDAVARRGGKNLACIADAASRILHGGDARIEVEFAAVVGRFGRFAEVQPEVAESLVNRKGPGDADHGSIRQRLGFGGVAFLQQAADLGDGFGGFGIAAVALIARPDGVLVKLDVLLADVAKDHGGETAIAYR